MRRNAKDPAHVWDEEKDAQLRAAYARGGVKAAFATFPTLPRIALYRRADQLGLRKFRAWTADEDKLVRRLWGEEPMEDISRKLGRPQRSVYLRAINHLGLAGGCPPGFEHLGHAAKRVGYDIGTLKKILAEADVEILPSYSYRDLTAKQLRTKGKWLRHLIVRTVEIDAAVEHRLATETLYYAACKRGMLPDTLRKILVADGVEPPNSQTFWEVLVEDLTPKVAAAIQDAVEATGLKVNRGKVRIRLPSQMVQGQLRDLLKELGVDPPKVKRPVWRILTEDIERALRRHEAKKTKLEYLQDAAKRHGIKYVTLSIWLKAAGVTFGRSGVPREVIDRVVARKKADKCGREPIRTAAKRLGLGKERLSQWLKEAGIEVVRGDKLGLPVKDINRVALERLRQLDEAV